MSKLTENVVTKTVMQPVKVKEREYTLTLSEDEAKAVYAVLLAVGGNPSTSPRGLIDNVQDQFVQYMHYEYAEWQKLFTQCRALYFADCQIGDAITIK